VDVDTKDISNDVTEKKINKIKKAVKQIYSCNIRTLNILSKNKQDFLSQSLVFPC
jgi:hypothetical protein